MYTAISQAQDTTSAVAELAAGIEVKDPALVLVFFSSRHSAAEVAKAARQAWPGAQTLGCSTSGELVSGAMVDGAMVAFALDRSLAPRVKLAVVDDMRNPARVDAACRDLGDILDGDIEHHVGIVLLDGMSGKEEVVMDRLGDLSNLRFIGGSAGDDLGFKATHVFANGEARTNAAVLAVVQTAHGYRIVKTQSFCKAGKTLVPTRVDAQRREVLEFNGKPARQAYMELVGASTTEEAASHFMSHPVGLMVGDDPYVRSPQAFAGDAMKFYCAVSEGMDLELLQSTDIIADTRQALADVNADGKVAALLNFNCILRTLELKAKQLTQSYADLFTIPTAGFSTYGEADIGHINQTATMIAFLR